MTRSAPATAEERRGTPPPARGNRLMQFVAATYDAEARTVEVVISTGADVKRWYGVESLAISPEAVDLSRVAAGQCKLLDSHNQYAIEGILGSVLSARIEGGSLIGVVKFADTDPGRNAEAMVSRGELTGVSAGYLVQTWQLTQIDDAGIETWLASRWQLLEVSLVSVPADPTAGVRSAVVDPPGAPAAIGSTVEDSDMQTRNQPGAGAGAPAPVVTAAAPAAQSTPVAPNDDAVRAVATAAVAAERTRVRTIRERTLAAGLPIDVANRLIDTGVELPHVGDRLVDEIAARGTNYQPARTPQGGLDEVETRRAGIEEALLNRFMPQACKLTDKGREWRGLRMIELARDVLQLGGAKVRGMPAMDVAQRALSTSDLPNILANVANKSLQMGYAAEPRTFLPFCTQHDAADFKQISSTMLSEGSNLETVNEHGEFRRGSVSDSAEKWNLTAYGKIFAVTRQALLNDDLQAFTRLPFMFGQAGVRLENDIVWGILTANAAMADTVALFHATHGNLQTGGGSALQISSMGTMRKNLRVQKGLDGNQTLNLMLRVIMVPAALETTLEQIMSPLLYASASASIVSPYYKQLVPVVEARLDVNSTTAWYGACDPGQNPTIEYGYLEGQDGTYLETRLGFEVDGMELKARHDFGAKAVNFRGLQKSAGA